MLTDPHEGCHYEEAEWLRNPQYLRGILLVAKLFEMTKFRITIYGGFMEKILKMKAFILFYAMLLLLPLGPLYAQQSQTDPPAILGNLKNAIDGSLKEIDGYLIVVSKKAALNGLEGWKIEKALGGLCHSVPGSIDCATVNPGGKMVTVMPAEYKKYKGADISTQEHVIRLQKTGKPVVSNVFRSVEGIDAVDIEHPAYLKNRELAGAVSLLFRPDAFLASTIAPVLKGLPYEAWLMQKDGRILYDTAVKQTGLMLFEDPLYRPYQSLLAAGRKIAADRKGKGFYEFLAVGKQRPVRKDIVWDTVELYGMEWRLVVVYSASPATTNRPLIGGDRDSHGCIGSAGYSWCESKQKCLRIWEEPCP